METATLRPFTSRTRVALAIARGIAAARGDRDLTPGHIVLGILREGRNPAIAALWYAGLTENGIHNLASDVEQALGDALAHPRPREVAIDLSDGEGNVVRLAEVAADTLQDEYLGTEHILLAILRYDDTTAERFAKRGISADQYHEGLLSVRRGDPPPHDPRATRPA